MSMASNHNAGTPKSHRYPTTHQRSQHHHGTRSIDMLHHCFSPYEPAVTTSYCWISVPPAAAAYQTRDWMGGCSAVTALQTLTLLQALLMNLSTERSLPTQQPEDPTTYNRPSKGRKRALRHCYKHSRPLPICPAARNVLQTMA